MVRCPYKRVLSQTGTFISAGLIRERSAGFWLYNSGVDPSHLRVIPCRIHSRVKRSRNTKPMSRRSGKLPNPKYWDSEFARFVRSYGTAKKFAIALGVHESAVYHWLRGAAVPKLGHVATILRIARERGFGLSFDQIWEHFSDLRADPEIDQREKRQAEREAKKAEEITAVREAKKAERQAAIEVLARRLRAAPALASS
jgi:transcriptional regulator with XRE-family HTH domain